MAREGARVAVADLDPESAAATVGLINAAGGQAISLGGDVTKSADVAGMVGSAVAAFGRLDGAFNNAGVAPHQVRSIQQRTHQWSDASFDRMIEVNLKSVWLCMKHEIPPMLASGGGFIVNTASVAGLIGLPSATAYTAAKHGVIGLTKTAALEYAGDGIRVNAVCPGFIDTRMTKFAVALKGNQIRGRIPMGRLGTPDEIAELVVWLCSDRASYVTGVAYAMDGGMTAS
jgi:NAD(P)-dependent dehydrogenase (short-subunit alcohol dehydrogenase family)